MIGINLKLWAPGVRIKCVTIMLCAVFPIGAHIIALMSLGQSDIVSTQHCVTFLYKEEFISLSSTPPPPVRTINKWKITFLHFVQEKIHEENILIFLITCSTYKTHLNSYIKHFFSNLTCFLLLQCQSIDHIHAQINHTVYTPVFWMFMNIHVYILNVLNFGCDCMTIHIYNSVVFYFISDSKHLLNNFLVNSLRM